MHGPETQGPEDDVAGDSALANSRAEGGRRDRDDGSDDDAVSTTGVDETEEFVGRAAGDDIGYAGETGAERRAT